MDVGRLQNAKITVIGAARSGVGVAKLLHRQGAIVFVSDKENEKKLGPYLDELRTLGVRFETGTHSNRVYDCSLLVISPGVPSNAPVVREAAAKGIKVVSELEVASWFCRSKVVGVTGSNGKTTTTTLIGRMLGDAKRRHTVAGNIGTAFSSVVLDMDETDTAVLEVSSFQLDHCEKFRPNIALILNITPDHLDRYENSMVKYSASKARIFMNQGPEDYVIYNADDEWTLKTVEAAPSRKIGFSTQKKLSDGAFVDGGVLVTKLAGRQEEIIATSEISIRGMHNLYNSMAAALVGRILGIREASLRATLRNFKGVEHRLEFVRELDGVRYINDSKATNVDSVWYALQAFEQPIVLILGGRDKGNDYTRLKELAKKHVRLIVAIGESAAKVEAEFANVVPVRRVSSMEEAVSVSRKLAKSGDIVLLSPACASFDWFQNYEHRGRVFKQLVSML
jgi:UDP-N-acetylmuramoylalanine--D-glutamate ligase